MLSYFPDVAPIPPSLSNPTNNYSYYPTITHTDLGNVKGCECYGDTHTSTITIIPTTFPAVTPMRPSLTILSILPPTIITHFYRPREGPRAVDAMMIPLLDEEVAYEVLRRLAETRLVGC